MSNLFVFGPSFLAIGGHVSAYSETANSTIAPLTNETNTPGSLVVPLADMFALYGGFLGMALCGFLLFWFFGMDKSYRGSFYKFVFCLFFFCRTPTPNVCVLTYAFFTCCVLQA